MNREYDIDIKKYLISLMIIHLFKNGFQNNQIFLINNIYLIWKYIYLIIIFKFENEIIQKFKSTIKQETKTSEILPKPQNLDKTDYNSELTNVEVN